DNIKKIIDIFMKDLKNRLKEKDITIEVTNSSKYFIFIYLYCLLYIT
ncbi:hypothetical protein I5581_16740, partial [Clostridioides difficile]|nr:hypothetical protein [Clostridioides difficile]